jgi:5-methylcytosine-specific restriction endonuclease McrA
MDVLVLNSSYEPHQILPFKKAIKLITKNRAEVLKSVKDRSVTSCYISIPMPSVILLNQYINYQRKPVPFSRLNVLHRDKNTCQYCGSKGERMTIDHVHPKTKGGENTWENTVASCQKCNTTKGDLSLEKFYHLNPEIAETSKVIAGAKQRRPSQIIFMKYFTKRADWEEFTYV